MNLEGLCFLFFAVELVLQAYMISSKRVKKYWSIYVGIVIAAYFFPFCLPAGDGGLKGFFEDFGSIMWATLPAIFSIGFLLIGNINRKEQNIQTNWKIATISLIYILAFFVGLAYIVS